MSLFSSPEDFEANEIMKEKEGERERSGEKGDGDKTKGSEEEKG
jgi:hypothetical protein